MNTIARPVRWRALNAVALALAVLLLGGLLLLWRADRAAPASEPRWETSRFAAVRAAEPGGVGERWIVAVQPDCGHCMAHLAELARVLAGRASAPGLGVLLVDLPRRPVADPIALPVPAGVWWDSAGVWRREWRRGAYGETYRFRADGSLVAAAPSDAIPDPVESP